MLPPLYGASGLLDNALQVFSAITGAASFVGGVAWAVRPQTHVREVPWWWWCANATALLLLALGNDLGLLQGALLVLGAFSLGIGVATFAAAHREGRIRFRRTKGSFYDYLAAEDWARGLQLVRVIDVTASFGAIRETNAYIDFLVQIINTSLHPAKLVPEVRGHIAIADSHDVASNLAHPPELRQVQRGELVSSAEGGINLERNDLVTVTLRQYLLSDTRDLLLSRAGTVAVFVFAGVDVGVVIWRNVAGRGVEEKERERLELTTYRLLIP